MRELVVVIKVLMTHELHFSLRLVAVFTSRLLMTFVVLALYLTFLHPCHIGLRLVVCVIECQLGSASLPYVVLVMGSFGGTSRILSVGLLKKSLQSIVVHY